MGVYMKMLTIATVQPEPLWMIAKNIVAMFPELAIFLGFLATVYKYQNATPLERVFASGTDRVWSKFTNIVMNIISIGMTIIVINFLFIFSNEILKIYSPMLFKFVRTISILLMVIVLPIALILEARALDRLSDAVLMITKYIPALGNILAIFIEIYFPAIFSVELIKEGIGNKNENGYLYSAICFLLAVIFAVIVLKLIHINVSKNKREKNGIIDRLGLNGMIRRIKKFDHWFFIVIILIVVCILFPYTMKTSLQLNNIFKINMSDSFNAEKAASYLISDKSAKILIITLGEWFTLILLGAEGLKINAKESMPELIVCDRNNEKKFYVYSAIGGNLICGDCKDQHDCKQFRVISMGGLENRELNLQYVRDESSKIPSGDIGDEINVEIRGKIWNVKLTIIDNIVRKTRWKSL